MRKLIAAITILLVLSACGMLAQAPASPTAAPSPAPATTAQVPTSPAAISTSAQSATATPPDQPALWLLDGAQDRQVAIDPQSGQILNTASHLYSPSALSRDGRWRYVLSPIHDNDVWHVGVLVQDLTRSLSPRRIPLTDFPGATFIANKELQAQAIALSADERQLIVSEAEKQDQQFITRVYVVDIASGKVTSTMDLWGESAAFVSDEALSAQVLTAPDGSHLWLVHNLMRTQPTRRDGPATWFTRITVVDWKSGRPLRMIDVPGDITAQGYWLSTTLAPDGKRLYVLQEIVRAGESDGYRFVAFDTASNQIAVSQISERANGGAPFCFYRFGLRLTPDGRYLWGYCGPSADAPTGYVEFMDVTTGAIAQKVPLKDVKGLQPGWSDNPFALQMALTPDNRTLYFGNATSKEVFAVDLSTRAVRQAALSDKPSTSYNPLQRLFSRLAGSFVGTASAKMYAQPGAVLSPDGERFYFVDIQDFEHGSGVWAVETRTLHTLGHWLSGKDVYGIRLSQDTRELYVASPNDYSVYVLDAQTGAPRRTLKQAQITFKPAGFTGAELE